MPDDKTLEAVALVRQAAEHLRDARDLLDEASELHPEPGVAASFSAYDGVVNAIRQLLVNVADWHESQH